VLKRYAAEIRSAFGIKRSGNAAGAEGDINVVPGGGNVQKPASSSETRRYGRNGGVQVTAEYSRHLFGRYGRNRQNLQTCSAPAQETT